MRGFEWLLASPVILALRRADLFSVGRGADVRIAHNICIMAFIDFWHHF